MDEVIWVEQRNFIGPVPPGEDPTILVPVDSQTGARIPGVGSKRLHELISGEKVKWLHSGKIEVYYIEPEEEDTSPSYELDEEGKPYKSTPLPPKSTPLPPKPTPLPSKAEIEATRMNPEALKNLKLDYLLPKVSDFPKERFLRWGEKGRDGNFILDPKDELRHDFIYFIIANGMIPFVSINPEKHEIILTKRNTDPTAKNSETFYLSHYLIGEKNEKIYRKVAEFMKREPYFGYAYTSTLPTSTKRSEGHIVLMKKRNSFTLVVSDSTGDPWSASYRQMTPNSVILTDILFRKAEFTNFEDESCQVQTLRGTCALWTTLAALYPNKSSKDIKKMIDAVIEKVGLPPRAETYDMVIKEIAYEFMVNPVPASSVNREEYMQGFGKLKGGMEYDKIKELIRMTTGIVQDPMIVSHINPLAVTYLGDLRDEKLQRWLDFIMANTDANDKKRLGIPVPGGLPVPENTIPLFELLDFAFNGTYNATELYNRVVQWFPKVKPPTSFRNFNNFRLYVTTNLINETIDVIEKRDLFEPLLNEMQQEGPTRRPPSPGTFAVRPPKKGGKLKGGIGVDQFIQLENKFKEDIKRNRNNKDKVLKQFSKFLYDVLENLDQNQEKHRGRLEVIIEKLMTTAALSFELNIKQLVPRPLYDTFYDTLFPEQPVLPTEPLGKPTKQPPKLFEPPPPKKGGKLKGKAMPEGLIPLQQMAKEAYNLVDPKKEINGWELKRWTSTLKFYVKGNEVIVAVRGTKTNAPDGNLDVTADLTIPFNGIPGTIRYKFDKAMVEKFQQEYPPSQYSYFAVGHSLGGAIIDSLIRDRLIREAVSYNPAIQFSDINRGLPNRRIYYGSDPLYRLMGWWDVKSEHREPENRTWADFLSGISLPAAAIAALPAHNLSNFEGGKRVSFT